MTGNDVKAEVLENLHLPSTTTDYDTQILRQTNRALAIMATEPVFTLVETSVSVSAATRKYVLPEGITRVDNCYLANRAIGLRRASQDEIYRFGSLTVTGEPQWFWEANEALFLHPMPDNSYTLFLMGKGAPPALTALTDTIYQYGTRELAPAYCIAIPEFVTWRFASTEKGDFAQLGAECKENWAALLKKAWDLDKARIARQYAGRIRSRSDDSLAWAHGVWIP